MRLKNCRVETIREAFFCFILVCNCDCIILRLLNRTFVYNKLKRPFQKFKYGNEDTLLEIVRLRNFKIHARTPNVWSHREEFCHLYSDGNFFDGTVKNYNDPDIEFI